MSSDESSISVFRRVLDKLRADFKPTVEEELRSNSEGSSGTVFIRFARSHPLYGQIVSSLVTLAGPTIPEVLNYLVQKMSDLLTRRKSRTPVEPSPEANDECGRLLDLLLYTDVTAMIVSSEAFSRDDRLRAADGRAKATGSNLVGCGLKLCMAPPGDGKFTTGLLEQWSVIFSVTSWRWPLILADKLAEYIFNRADLFFILMRYVRLDADDAPVERFLGLMKDHLKKAQRMRTLSGSMLESLSTFLLTYNQPSTEPLKDFFSTALSICQRDNPGDLLCGAVDLVTALLPKMDWNEEQIDTFYEQKVYPLVHKEDSMITAVRALRYLLFGRNIRPELLFWSWRPGQRQQSSGCLGDARRMEPAHPTKVLRLGELFVKHYLGSAHIERCSGLISDTLLQFASFDFEFYTRTVTNVDTGSFPLFKIVLGTVSTINTQAWMDEFNLKGEVQQFNQQFASRVAAYLKTLMEDFDKKICFLPNPEVTKKCEDAAAKVDKVFLAWKLPISPGKKYVRETKAPRTIDELKVFPELIPLFLHQAQLIETWYDPIIKLTAVSDAHIAKSAMDFGRRLLRGEPETRGGFLEALLKTSRGLVMSSEPAGPKTALFASIINLFNTAVHDGETETQGQAKMIEFMAFVGMMCQDSWVRVESFDLLKRTNKLLRNAGLYSVIEDNAQAIASDATRNVMLRQMPDLIERRKFTPGILNLKDILGAPYRRTWHYFLAAITRVIREPNGTPDDFFARQSEELRSHYSLHHPSDFTHGALVILFASWTVKSEQGELWLADKIFKNLNLAHLKTLCRSMMFTHQNNVVTLITKWNEAFDNQSWTDGDECTYMFSWIKCLFKLLQSIEDIEGIRSGDLLPALGKLLVVKFHNGIRAVLKDQMSREAGLRNPKNAPPDTDELPAVKNESSIVKTREILPKRDLPVPKDAVPIWKSNIGKGEMKLLSYLGCINFWLSGPTTVSTDYIAHKQWNDLWQFLSDWVLVNITESEEGGAPQLTSEQKKNFARIRCWACAALFQLLKTYPYCEVPTDEKSDQEGGENKNVRRLVRVLRVGERRGYRFIQTYLEKHFDLPDGCRPSDELDETSSSEAGLTQQRSGDFPFKDPRKEEMARTRELVVRLYINQCYCWKPQISDMFFDQIQQKLKKAPTNGAMREPFRTLRVQLLLLFMYQFQSRPDQDTYDCLKQLIRWTPQLSEKEKSDLERDLSDPQKELLNISRTYCIRVAESVVSEGLKILQNSEFCGNATAMLSLLRRWIKLFKIRPNQSCCIPNILVGPKIGVLPGHFLRSLLQVTEKRCLIGQEFDLLVDIWLDLINVVDHRELIPIFLVENAESEVGRPLIKALLSKADSNDQFEAIARILFSRCRFSYYAYQMYEMKPTDRIEEIKEHKRKNEGQMSDDADPKPAFEVKSWIPPLIGFAVRDRRFSGKFLGELPWITHFAILFHSNQGQGLFKRMYKYYKLDYSGPTLSSKALRSQIVSFTDKMREKMPEGSDGKNYMYHWKKEAMRWIVGTKDHNTAYTSLVVLNKLLVSKHPTKQLGRQHCIPFLSGLIQAVAYHVEAWPWPELPTELYDLINQTFKVFRRLPKTADVPLQEIANDYIKLWVSFVIAVDAYFPQMLKLFSECLPPEVNPEDLFQILRPLFHELESNSKAAHFFEDFDKRFMNDDRLKYDFRYIKCVREKSGGRTLTKAEGENVTLAHMNRALQHYALMLPTASVELKRRIFLESRSIIKRFADTRERENKNLRSSADIRASVVRTQDPVTAGLGSAEVAADYRQPRVTESVDQQALVAIFQTALEALPAMRPALKFIKEIVTFEPLISTIPLIQENDYKQAVPRVEEELRALAKKIKVNYGQIFIKDCVTLTDCQHLGSSSNLLGQSIAVTDQIKRLKAGNQDLDRSQLPKVIPFTSQAKMLESILKGDATAPGSQETKVKPPAAPRTFVSKWSRTISAVGHELVKQLATFVGTAADEDKNEWTVIPEPRELVDDSKWPKYELKADSPIPSSEFWQLKLDPSAQGDGKSTG